MYDLHEIYNSQSETAQSIIDDYKLYRSRVIFVGFNADVDTNYQLGLKLLKEQTIKDLEDLANDVYGAELLMAESIRFLMYLLTFEFKPFHDWGQYYRDLLDYFHSKNLLTWKYRFTIHKEYKNKRVILTIADENVKLNYKSTQAVINDWGRYKADIILSKRTKLNNQMTLTQVLQLVI